MPQTQPTTAPRPCPPQKTRSAFTCDLSHCDYVTRGGGWYVMGGVPVLGPGMGAFEDLPGSWVCVFSPTAPVSQVSKDLERHKGDQMAQKSQGE